MVESKFMSGLCTACRALLLAAGLLCAWVLSGSGAAVPAVTYDQRSLILNGTRQLILSGGIHYARLVPEDWARTFTMAKDMGLNTIQTYVFWNLHEQHKGQSLQIGEVIWTGQANLREFVLQAQAQGLHVTLRIGPYVCGEYQFGGLPLWLRSEDNITCFRCSDPVWKREMARFVAEVVQEMAGLLYPSGPIIMMQIENEYTGTDQAYLQWSVEMARNLTTAIPWNLCHDVDQCAAVNAAGQSVLCTINGFWMEERNNDPHQPSPAWLDTQWMKNPDQPAIWTEDQGWFDQWGVAQRVRFSSDQAYGIMRFFAYGGSWHNFYMLSGGNNYGRQSGGDVVTAYAPDTAINSLLLAHEPRYSFYRSMFKALSQAATAFFNNPIPSAHPLILRMNTSTGATAQQNNGTLTAITCYQYGDDSQRWNFSAQPEHYGTVSLGGQYAGLCLSLANLHPATMVKCKPGATEQQFMMNETLHHISSLALVHCQMAGNPGQCRQCLDKYQGTSSIDFWDCKLAGGKQMSNQAWYYDASQQQVLDTQGNCLTYAAVPQPSNSSGAEAHVYGSIVFLSNYQETGSGIVTWEGHDFYLTNHSVVLVNMSATPFVLFNSSNIDDTATASYDAQKIAMGPWVAFLEPVAGARNTTYSPSGLPEQLAITDNDSDYAWYIQTLSQAGKTLRVESLGGGRAYAYFDGQLLLSDNQNREDGKLTFYVPPVSAVANDSKHQLQIFSCAMGLSNVGVGPSSGKGLQSVSFDGKELAPGPWTVAWQMNGEYLQIFTANGSRQVIWRPAADIASTDTLVWFKSLFDLPASLVAARAQSAAQPLNVSVALSITTMNKGVVYVNGFNIGRYNNQPGLCSGDCAPPKHGNHCYMHFKDCGQPTQTYYHIPFALLQPRDNLVVLFEETAIYQSARELEAVQVVVLSTPAPPPALEEANLHG